MNTISNTNLKSSMTLEELREITAWCWATREVDVDEFISTFRNYRTNVYDKILFCLVAMCGGLVFRCEGMHSFNTVGQDIMRWLECEFPTMTQCGLSRSYIEFEQKDEVKLRLLFAE